MKKIFKNVVVAVLIFEARLVLKKYKPKIIAVSGSVGKTSTKDAIYTALRGFSHVRKSQKSFNSEIGIPLTILGLKNAWNDPMQWLKTFAEGLCLFLLPSKYPDLLILEVGADRPGDIENVTKWMKPDISVITKLSDVPVHVEFFASPEEVKHEKSNLARALKKDGTLILNADDSDVMSFASLTPAKTITYGFLEGANVKASDYKITYEVRDGINFPIGISYTVECGGEKAEVSIKGTIGMQTVYTTLGAIAVGYAEGKSLAQLVEALTHHETPPGRMRILAGINSSIIIDDSYNSSPIAQKEALEALNSLSVSGRKIAMLGDMLELGSFSVAEHRVVGEHVAKVCSMLITVGVRSCVMREAAIASGMTESSAISFDDSRKAGEYLASIIAPGDAVLVKGSQGNLRMERGVEVIMRDKKEKARLLVRQDPEWQNR